MNDSILDCRHISAPQQVHFIFDSQQYNLGPDGREVIGIIVHVPPCHCVHLFHHIINVLQWLREDGATWDSCVISCAEEGGYNYVV